MAELADAPDLGSGALRRGGSSPFSRTNFIAPFEVLFFLPKIRRFYGYSIKAFTIKYKINYFVICYNKLVRTISLI